MSELTDQELDFLSRLWAGQPLRGADREEDKVRQRCRKAGLAHFGGSPCCWHITDAGRSALVPHPLNEEPR
jgi:hypothetical protein